MLLKELYDLYERLCASGENLPRPGMSVQNISYRIIIRPSGELVRIEDAREPEVVIKKNKKGVTEKTEMRMRTMLVLGGTKSSGSGVNPCFLWDNVTYMLGVAKLDEKQNNKKRIAKCFHTFRKKHLDMEQEINSPAYSAVCRFLENWNPELFPSYNKNPDIFKGFGVFMLEGATRCVHEDSKVVEWWQANGEKSWSASEKKDKEIPQGLCLVTGKMSPIAALHSPAIKGVIGAPAMGAKLVSFNLSAFASYGKEKGLNAPVSEYAAFAYCNALNYLMSRDSRRVRLGDATVVFWTDAPQKNTADEMEMLIAGGLDADRVEAVDSELAEQVSLKLQDIARGKNVLDIGASSVRFFILGLAPNESRLLVRFYFTGTMGDFVRNLQQHYADLSLQRGGGKFNDSEIITPYMLLLETVRDSKEIPPMLGGALMRSILQNQPYPDAIALAVFRRFRADRNVNYKRCAFLKAWLSRKSSTYNVRPMLDETNVNPGYVLGRLFSILCKTQEDAMPNMNRRVRDAFYASASSSPSSVFPHIIKTYNYHLAKMEGGRRVNREKLMLSVMGLITAFPAHLNLEQQGLFALGFYHQTQAFYTSSKQEN